MKIVFILILALFPFYSQSSSWIGNDAVWHYSWSDGTGSSGGYEKIEYVRDSVIDGQQVQVLEGYRNIYVSDIDKIIHFSKTETLPERYVYESGDTVFYYNDSAFHVLYNFGSEKGDRWNLGVDTNGAGLCGAAYVTVEETGTIEINGETRRWIRVQPDSNASVLLSGKIIEGIGAVEGYLFPTKTDCIPDVIYEWPLYDFRCYEDHSFPLYQLSTRACDWPASVVSLEEKTRNEAGVGLYPNPVSDQLLVDINASLRLSSVQVLDMKGRQLMESNSTEIDVSSLSPGIYTVIVTLEHPDLFSQEVSHSSPLFFKIIKK